MNRLSYLIGPALGIGLLPGCNPAAVTAPEPQSPPAVSRPAERTRLPAAPEARLAGPDVSWDTERDRPFAEFLKEKSGGMIRKAAVGIERRGSFRVELDRSVAPEDTLDLTKSLMAGARKDFPDKPITLSVFDPKGEPILRARYKVGQGVEYKIAHDPAGSATHQDESASPAPATAPADRPGGTEADRKFAAWAEEHGKNYLRYVEADLERHGRLWFGVTRDVKPADVPDLTKSLLEGARKEFPRGELVAVVFDPNGDKIGKAHLTGASSITWEH